MIIRLDDNSLYLKELEHEFSDVFNVEKVKKDIKENVFTNYLIYLVNNKPIAFINYYVMYERCELININVLESYQGRKIASLLMEEMINDCISKKVSSITLEVKITNTIAINLYHKFLFKEVGIRKGYYHGIDGILMEKELM